MLACRAQIGAEAIFAVSIVLFLGLVVSVFSAQQTASSESAFGLFSAKAECEKLSSVIYAVSSAQQKASVSFTLDEDALVSGGTISIGDYYCGFLGTALDSNLAAGGYVAFKNSGGVVVFESSS